MHSSLSRFHCNRCSHIYVNKCCSSTVIYIIENRLSERAVWSSCIILCQGSIARGIPINVDICCSWTVIYQIENRLSEHAVEVIAIQFVSIFVLLRYPYFSTALEAELCYIARPISFSCCWDL